MSLSIPRGTQRTVQVAEGVRGHGGLFRLKRASEDSAAVHYPVCFDNSFPSSINPYTNCVLTFNFPTIESEITSSSMTNKVSSNSLLRLSRSETHLTFIEGGLAAVSLDIRTFSRCTATYMPVTPSILGVGFDVWTAGCFCEPLAPTLSSISKTVDVNPYR